MARNGLVAPSDALGVKMILDATHRTHVHTHTHHFNERDEYAMASGDLRGRNLTSMLWQIQYRELILAFTWN